MIQTGRILDAFQDWKNRKPLGIELVDFIMLPDLKVDTTAFPKNFSSMTLPAHIAIATDTEFKRIPLQIHRPYV